MDQVITIKEHQPVKQTASLNSANLNTITFNIDYIARHDPQLAVQLYELADQAKRLVSKLERARIIRKGTTSVLK